MPMTIENLIIIIGLIIILFMVIQAKIKLMLVKKNFSNKKANNKLSGMEIARKILDANELDTLYILENMNNYRNYYDSSRNVIYLSSDVFNGEDVYALSVAAHEAGLALQNKNKLLSVRDIFIPIMNIILYFGYIMLMLTIFTHSWTDIKTTVIIFGFVLFFHLITLPLEYSASHLAKEQLIKNDLVTKKEIENIDVILNALVSVYIASIIDNIINGIKDLIGTKNNQK